MRRKTRILVALLGGALALSGGTVTAAEGEAEPAVSAGDSAGQAPEVAPSAHPRCQLHNGHAIKGKSHFFETVFTPDRMCIYLYSAEEGPMTFEGTRGLATVRFEGGKVHVLPMQIEFPSQGEPTVFFCPMHPAVVQHEPGTCPECGMKLLVQNRMAALADIASVVPGEMSAVFHLYTLPGEDADVMLTRPFRGLDQLESAPKGDVPPPLPEGKNVIKGPGKD